MSRPDPSAAPPKVGGPITIGSPQLEQVLEATPDKARPVLPQNFEQWWKLAEIACSSAFAPKGFNIQTCFLAMQYGASLGLEPLAALQGIGVINGKPSLYGDALLAVCMASKDWLEMSESIEGEGENRKAVCVVSRKGKDGKAKETRQEFSWGEAVKAKLTTKEGPWKNYPRRMMQMRARSWALRDAFADALRGVKSYEEERDLLETVVEETEQRLEEPDKQDPPPQVKPGPPQDEPPKEEAEPPPPEPEGDPSADLLALTPEEIWERYQAWLKGKHPKQVRDLRVSLGFEIDTDKMSQEDWLALHNAISA